MKNKILKVTLLYIAVFVSLSVVVGLLQVASGQGFLYITGFKLLVRLLCTAVLTWSIGRRIWKDLKW